MAELRGWRPTAVHVDEADIQTGLENTVQISGANSHREAVQMAVDMGFVEATSIVRSEELPDGTRILRPVPKPGWVPLAAWTPPCVECGALDGHKMGCLTPEVQAGRMTPRQRQIKLLEASERQRTPAQQLQDAINAAGCHGGRIEKIVVGQRAWQAIATSLPNGSPLSPRHGLNPSQGQVKYAGYPVEVSATVDPDAIYAVRLPDPPVGFSNIQGSSAFFKNASGQFQQFGRAVQATANITASALKQMTP